MDDQERLKTFLGVEGLKSGKIGSTGLDVYEEEAGIFFHNMSDKVLTDDVLARLMTFNVCGCDVTSGLLDQRGADQYRRYDPGQRQRIRKR
jgi:hypothetical protein